MYYFRLLHKHKPYASTTLRISLGLVAPVLVFSPPALALKSHVFENMAPFMGEIITDLGLLLCYGEAQDGGKKQS